MSTKRILDLAGLALALMVAGGGEVLAQTWQGTTDLLPPPPKVSCVKGALTYEFTLAEPEFSVKTPTGQIYRGPVSPDGRVKIVFTSSIAAAGIVTISGNARKRDLSVSYSAQSECSYRLVTRAPPKGGEHWLAGNWAGTSTVQSIAGGSPTTFNIFMIVAVNGGVPTCTFLTAQPKCELKDDHLFLEKTGEGVMALYGIDLVRTGSDGLAGTARGLDPNVRVTLSLKRI